MNKKAVYAVETMPWNKCKWEQYTEFAYSESDARTIARGLALTGTNARVIQWMPACNTRIVVKAYPATNKQY